MWGGESEGEQCGVATNAVRRQRVGDTPLLTSSKLLNLYFGCKSRYSSAALKHGQAFIGLKTLWPMIMALGNWE